MSFVNTVDIIGDEALTNSILNGSITEIADNRVTSVGDSAFRGCSALIRADFPSVTGIYNTAFYDCSVLATLILRSETMCTLYYTGSFDGSPIAAGTGYIYVPSALYDSYLADSKWSIYANQFRKLEDYTVDGTVTGEFRLPISFDTTDFSLGYSVEWDYTQSSPALTRTGLAAGFSDPVPATSLTAAGSSPFDNVMPWAGMKKYNIIDGAVAYSEDDAGFSMTDYDTVVYIPEFYYAAYKDEANSKWRWSISPVEKEGYALHPGSGRYIGRYHTSGDGTAVFSKSGATGRTDTHSNAINYSHNKGENWWLLDIATWSAVQLLYLVEFANFDSQTMLGVGYSAFDPKMGGTDSAAYHTYKSDNTPNQYRWIEFPFGGKYDRIDGIGVSYGTFRIKTAKSTSTDTSTYEDTGIKSNGTAGFVTSFVYIDKFPWLFIADAFDGTSATYVTDYADFSNTSNFCVGGNSSSNDTLRVRNGFFMLKGLYISTAGIDYGSRLIFIP
jgi:hypothetical protein